MNLTARFDQALLYATLIHAHQKRKETDIPYVAHLLGVASIALEYGATEDEAIGALLHDAVEDAGGKGRLEDIRVRFGEAVAGIVHDCTDTDETPKPAWEPRKLKYIARVPTASPSACLVSAADKLHNARAILRDLHRLGKDLWPRFNGGKAGTIWYYGELIRAYRKVGHDELVDELDRVVTEIEQLADCPRTR
jgi:GTP pyrophosphokinase